MICKNRNCKNEIFETWWNDGLCDNCQAALEDHHDREKEDRKFEKEKENDNSKS